MQLMCIQVDFNIKYNFVLNIQDKFNLTAHIILMLSYSFILFVFFNQFYALCIDSCTVSFWYVWH